MGAAATRQGAQATEHGHEQNLDVSEMTGATWCNNFFDWMELALAPESACWLVLEDRYHLFRLSSWSKAPLPHGQNHLYNFAYVVPHGSIKGLKAE